MSNIDSRAAIEEGAIIGKDVTVSPFAFIGKNVKIGDGCFIGPHVVLTGNTTIGKGTKIHCGANIGDEPQDVHYNGQNSFTEIGENCIIREYVTIHRGVEEDSCTRVGNNVMLMAFVHLGHNCQIADEVIIANASLLAGRVEVGRHAFLSGMTMVHQFCRIGALAMIGGGMKITQDVPPFSIVQDNAIQGINAVGLRRANWNAETILAIKNAIKIACLEGYSRPNAIEKIKNELPDLPEVRAFVEFLQGTKRGLLTGNLPVVSD
ncbi:MAG: acyl-ACP--UDP-N-acetylglucosamine O-acyltransferase [Lentisphaeria bacterium]|nr:acyl-ACP--UDP-N-acetylglucosamine O-acyltransferase [Lentisphaeria bacterium]